MILYIIDCITTTGIHKEIKGFKTPNDAYKYIIEHPEEDFGDYPLVLLNSE